MASRLTIGPERVAAGRQGRPMPAVPPVEPAVIGAGVLATAPTPRQRDLMVVTHTATAPAEASGLAPALALVPPGAGWDLPEPRGRHAGPDPSGDHYQRERIAAVAS
jgi:hypothetical protein